MILHYSNLFFLILSRISSGEGNLDNDRPKIKSSFSFTIGRWHPPYAKSYGGTEFKLGHQHPRSKFHEMIVSIFKPYPFLPRRVSFPVQNDLDNLEDSSLIKAPKLHMASFEPFWHPLFYGETRNKLKSNLASKEIHRDGEVGQQPLFDSHEDSLKAFPGHTIDEKSKKIMKILRHLGDGLESDINNFLVSARTHDERGKPFGGKEHHNIKAEEGEPRPDFKTTATHTETNEDDVEILGSTLTFSDPTIYHSRIQKLKNNHENSQTMVRLKSSESDSERGNSNSDLRFNNKQNHVKKSKHDEPSHFNLSHLPSGPHVHFQESQDLPGKNSSDARGNMAQNGVSGLNRNNAIMPTVTRGQNKSKIISVPEVKRGKLHSTKTETVKSSIIYKNVPLVKNAQKTNLDSDGSFSSAYDLSRDRARDPFKSNVQVVHDSELRYLRDVSKINDNVKNEARSKNAGKKEAINKSTKKEVAISPGAKASKVSSNDKDVAGLFVLFDHKQRTEMTGPKKSTGTYQQGKLKTEASKSLGAKVNKLGTGHPEVQSSPLTEPNTLPEKGMVEKSNGSAPRPVLMLPESAWVTDRYGRRARRVNRLNNHTVVGVVVLCVFLSFVIVLGFTIVRIRNEEPSVRRVNSRTHLYESHPFY